MYKDLFFDLDGTICDSLPGIVKGIRFAMNQNGTDELDEDEIKKLVGIPLNDSLKRFYPDNAEMIQKTVGHFRTYYAEKGLFESELYDGIKELLEDLSSVCRIHLITAKPTGYATKILEHHGVLQCFE